MTRVDTQLRLALLEAPAPPLRPVPAGAVQLGPPATCFDCGAISGVFGYVVDCEWSFVFDPDRRDPLCADCTVKRVRAEHDRGLTTPASLAWALRAGETP